MPPLRCALPTAGISLSDHSCTLDLLLSTPGQQSSETLAMKTIIESVLSLTFLCLLAVGPKAQAVLPPPDGGYANFTTAEGTNALLNLTTGAGNTALGWFSLSSIS